ncbi:MAG: hypothetical protein JWO38_501 [Gemmataceae bacterium]|nr:hypothetical protein [Gemmataceae bacterium]
MATRVFPALAVAGAVFVLVAGGCGGDAPAEVRGVVRIDGQPLRDGEIIFEAVDGATTPGAGPIKDGRYEVRVTPGPKKVRITASRPARKADPVMGAAAREQMIAKEFNKQTRLTAEIKPGKNEGVDFDVNPIP